MSDETSAALEPHGKKINWGGGISPFNVSYGKLMMWMFLVSDAFSFSGLLIGLGFARHSHADWPNVAEVFSAFPGTSAHLPMAYVGLMTFILIVSSVTMALAVEAGRRMDKATVSKYMLWTIIGGLFFLLSQVWEWSHFIHGTEEGAQMTFLKGGQWVTETFHGANLNMNEYGPKLFATFFFVITGFHGFHVFSGVVINIIIYIMVMNGSFERRGHYEMVEKVGLYWHFVDLVWVFVFTFYYLL
ncbi:MAG: cytochrome c oxidase subunit 3 [Bacteroidia bacterium]|nr:cytochrome c oxidase subunit 3 [Bacteroidia bacterium]